MTYEILENGLRVAVVVKRTAPVVSVHLAFDVGTRDELPGEEGVAHLLEHMLFKGTPRRGLGQAAAAIERSGGDLNAWTDHDQITLHATVHNTSPATFAETLDVLVDMARYPLFDADELARERDVVIEEIRRYDDDPDAVVAERAASRVFGDHPYGRPVLGTAASVRSHDVERVRGFWARGFGPDRAVLVVVGDVDRVDVIAAVRAQCEGWAPAGPRAECSLALCGSGRWLDRIERPFESAIVELAWPGPPLGHPDAAALEVLLAALGDGASSILTARLQLDRALANSVWATVASRPRGGAIGVGFRPHEGATIDALHATLEEIERVQRYGMAGRLIERSRQAILSDLTFSSETADGIAGDIVSSWGAQGDPLAYKRFRDAVAAVTPEDVARVARSWLAPDHRGAVVLDRTVSTRIASKALDVGARGSPKSAVARSPEPVRKVYPNGATLWILPDDGQVAAAHVVLLGGGLLEEERVAGLGVAWSELLSAGAGELDATDFAEAMDEASTDLSGYSGPTTMGLRATFPSAWSDEALDLVGAALVEPRFESAEWKRVREELLDDLRSLPDRPEEVADITLQEQLWPNHPWRLPPRGTPSTLRKLGRRVFEGFHAQHVVGANVVVAVAGGVDPQMCEEVLEPWLERLDATPFLLPERAPCAPVRPTFVRRFAGSEQAQVVLGMRGQDLHGPDRFALDLAAALLDGQAGRLFLSLREARGLAYSVWCNHRPGWDGGVFSAGLGTAPDRAADAAAALRAEIERLASDGPAEEELERVRRMIIGQSAIEAQRASWRAARVALCERLGLPVGVEAWHQALAEVTCAHVQRALGAAYAQGAVLVEVVPPEAQPRRKGRRTS